MDVLAGLSVGCRWHGRASRRRRACDRGRRLRRRGRAVCGPRGRLPPQSRPERTLRASLPAAWASTGRARRATVDCRMRRRNDGSTSESRASGGGVGMTEKASRVLCGARRPDPGGFRALTPLGRETENGGGSVCSPRRRCADRSGLAVPLALVGVHPVFMCVAAPCRPYRGRRGTADAVSSRLRNLRGRHEQTRRKPGRRPARRWTARRRTPRRAPAECPEQDREPVRRRAREQPPAFAVIDAGSGPVNRGPLPLVRR